MRPVYAFLVFTRFVPVLRTQRAGLAFGAFCCAHSVAFSSRTNLPSIPRACFVSLPRLGAQLTTMRHGENQRDLKKLAFLCQLVFTSFVGDTKFAFNLKHVLRTVAAEGLWKGDRASRKGCGVAGGAPLCTVQYSIE